MKYKKSIIILILIISLFTITSTYASDVNDTSIGLNNEHNNMETAINDKNISIDYNNENKLTTGNIWYVNSTSQDNEGSLEKPFKNLKDALAQCSDGDTIMIASGKYMGNNNTNLTINQNNLILKKYGDGEVIFNGKDENRIFNINSNSIFIDGLTFIKGKSEYGGAIYFNNDLVNSQINATFRNNNAINGGAIYFNGNLNNVTLNGIFNNNYANAKYIGGGANFFNGTLNNVNISGIFSNNGAYSLYSDGGANYFDKELTNVNILADFIANYADGGGAMNEFRKSLTNITLKGNYINNTGFYTGNEFIGSVTNITITGFFSNNRASNAGGVNLFKNNVINAYISGNFTNNVGVEGGINDFQDTADNITITGNFINNIVDNMGGANSFEKTATNIIITGYFVNNTSVKGGSANVFHREVYNLTLSGSYINNTVHQQYLLTYGGGAANYFGNSIINATITGDYINNSAFGDTDKVNGGVNYFAGEYFKNVTISGNYINNSATGAGGANCFFNGLNNATLTGCYINNSAYCGGANSFEGHISSNINISGTYINNSADEDGGVNQFYSANLVNITLNGIFINNHVKNKMTYSGGGANSFNYELNNSFINGTYINNTAYQGGANYFWCKLFNSTISGNYENNTAWNGGVNYFGKIINNTNVSGIYKNNHVSSHGGAFYICKLDETAILSGIFIGNIADNNGGAIYNENNNLTLKNSLFINNTANGTGGAIYSTGLNLKVYDCSFFNNTAETNNVMIFTKYNLNADYNWFGNNKTNYNKTSPINANCWLFLGAEKSKLSSNGIVFKLYLYNSTSDKITEYDNNSFKNINLTITSNGKVDKHFAKLGETIKYSAINTETGSITATIENTTYTIEFDLKADSNLTVNSQTLNYTNNTTITLNYNNTANGTLNITLKGKKFNYIFTDLNLNKIISLGNIKPDEYNITVIYSGNEIFSSMEASGKLTVKKLETNMQITARNITVNDTNGIMFIITLPENATGNITISNGEIINVINGKKINNTLIIEILNNEYSSGEYTWTFTFSDDIYNDSKANATSNILKLKSKITPTNEIINLIVGQTSTVNYTIIPDNINEVIFTSSNSSIVNVDSVTGEIIAKQIGSANITISFSGNKDYEGDEKTILVNVYENIIPKQNLTLIAKSNPIETGENATIIVTGFIKATGNVTARIGNGIYITPINNGTATFIISGIIQNTTAYITYSGDDNYNNASTNADIIITSKKPINTTVNINITNIELNINSNTTIVVTTSPIVLNVTFTSSNESVVKVDELGNVFAVGEGSAIITVSVGDGVIYAKNSTEVKITVNKVETKPAVVNVNISSMELNIGSNSTIVVTTSPVVLNVTFTSSNESVVKVDDLGNVFAVGEGSAIITVSVGDGVIYAKNSTEIEITINKIKTELTASPITTIYNINKDLVITLKDNANNPLTNVSVSVNLKGDKTYITDKNGQIKIPTIKLDPQTYTATLTYNGDDKYAKTTGFVKITIIKATPKLIAKKKTYKVNKVKKFKVKLKDNTGKAINKAIVKISIKKLKKNKKKKTNSKGKATFKINKKKKGKYLVKIKYLGNKYYNAVTKKVKIKIK